jgi:hypothetical protein
MAVRVGYRNPHAQENLDSLDSGMPEAQVVKILAKNGGWVHRRWVHLSPLPPQPEPANLIALKAELPEYWTAISLLDILKETDLRLFGSASAFKHARASLPLCESLNCATKHKVKTSSFSP